MEIYIPYKRKWKDSWGSSIIQDKVDFKSKTTTENKEGHYIMMKESIQEEDITFVNVYAQKIVTIVV